MDSAGSKFNAEALYIFLFRKEMNFLNHPDYCKFLKEDFILKYPVVSYLFDWLHKVHQLGCDRRIISEWILER
jgi:hypothetical protein